MIPMRLPPSASVVATLAVRFDLPVPPRKEWMEIILAMDVFRGIGSAGGQTARAQIPGAGLEILEIVAAYDGGDLPAFLGVVDLHTKLADLILQLLVAQIRLQSSGSQK